MHLKWLKVVQESFGNSCKFLLVTSYDIKKKKRKKSEVHSPFKSETKIKNKKNKEYHVTTRKDGSVEGHLAFECNMWTPNKYCVLNFLCNIAQLNHQLL